MPAINIDAHEAMQSILDYNGIRNFDAAEVFFLGRKNKNPQSGAYDKNHIPPLHLWWNMVPTLKVLDQLRDEMALPIIITSAYRSDEYNAAIGGSPKSMHLEFRAVDFIISGDGGPEEWAQKLKTWRDAGMFTGGIGVYNTMVHLDTRPYNATW